MKATRMLLTVRVLSAVVVLLGLSVWVESTPLRPAPTGAAAKAALESLVPARLLETRSGANNTTTDGAFQGIGRRSTGSTVELTVAGRGGVPTDAAAVMLNLTAVAPSEPGHLTAWPCGGPRPTASNVNYTAGSVVANAVLAKVGTGGRVCIFTHAATDLVVDVNGYAPGVGFESLMPARLLETRSGANNTTIDGQFQDIGRRPAQSTMELPVAGRGGVPANASAVMLNLTAVVPSGPGHVTVWPCGSPRPTASNLNYTSGAVVANAVLAKVGGHGKVCIETTGEADLIADVNGFVPHGGSLATLIPARLLDTRSGFANTTIDDRFQGIGRQPTGATVELTVAGRAGVPSDASAVMLNLTAIAPSGPGHVTVWPCGGPKPTASNLNYTAGAVVANTVFAKVGTDGKVCIATHAEADLVADVNGYVPIGGTVGTSFEPLVVRLNGSVPEGLHFDNMQALAKRSAGLDGSTVVFAARNGLVDDGYTPIARGEQCRGGYCTDLYVRDLKARKTVSVSAGINVGNQHEHSLWPFAYAGGSWAVSADHDTFLMAYSCYREYGWGPETIGGTSVCGLDDPDDGRPLVVHRRSTGVTEVIGFQYADAIDVSDDGATALFTDIGDAPAPCFAKGWNCDGYGNERLAVWRRGIGVVGVTARIADRNSKTESAQIQVINAVVSGDGKVVTFDASGFRVPLNGGSEEELSRLYRHVLDTGVTTEIPIPDERYPAGAWSVLDTDRRGDVVALSYQEYGSAVDPEYKPRRLFIVDLAAGATTEVRGATCDPFMGSMSGDGRYLGCLRDFHVPPTVVNLQTGAIGELFPPDSSLSRFGASILSRDGWAAVTRAVTGPAKRERGYPFDEQLYAITLEH